MICLATGELQGFWIVMQGKVVVATGATSGIGAVAVEALAKLGARIVFVARDGAKAEATRLRLEEIAPGLGHSYHLADLTVISETKRAGAQIASFEPRIDVLVNNAGAMFAARRVTAEGLEKTFALNHMSYFTLTKMLVDRLKQSAPARIVSTASAAHFGAALDFDDLQSARAYSAMKVYGRSKLANILFTRELARRLAGSGVVANSQHPGFVATRFGDEAGGWLGRIIPLAKVFALSPTVGADTLIYLASDPQAGAVSGGYFVKRQPAPRSREAESDEAAARLWDISEALFAKY
jgi:NAD(P)-dependent dehydrogenase (short-subunit alcohol dehydrogenase family)